MDTRERAVVVRWVRRRRVLASMIPEPGWAGGGRKEKETASRKWNGTILLSNESRRQRRRKTRMSIPRRAKRSKHVALLPSGTLPSLPPQDLTLTNRHDATRSALDLSGAAHSFPFLRLPHPRTKATVLFLPYPTGKTREGEPAGDALLEVQKVGNPNQEGRSWFVEEEVVSGSSSFILMKEKRRGPKLMDWMVAQTEL